MLNFLGFVTLALALTSPIAAFPTYASLAGLSREELDSIIPTLQRRLPGNPPGPLQSNGTKLVNDVEHSWEPLKEGDIRGPCPGLNTLASHGVSLRVFEIKKGSDRLTLYSISPVMALLHQRKLSEPYKKVSRFQD